MAKPLRIALTKGRLEKDTVSLLEKLGYDCTAVREKGRRLILPIPDANLEVVLAKANDVITYVEHGVCDMGVVGKDTIIEMQGKFFGRSWIRTLQVCACHQKGQRLLQRIRREVHCHQVPQCGTPFL